LAEFYMRAFGFASLDRLPKDDPDFAKMIDLAGGQALTTTMRLGAEIVTLAQVAPAGRPYPDAVPGYDPLFQHFAIVVSDMVAAYAALRAIDGWMPISTDGPQTLPPSSGGVTAYKFRDPEGHPLELLAFPVGAVPAHWANQAGHPCRGIDHSAISVANTRQSVAFYAKLGLRRVATSLNSGIEQERLDGVASPVVEVTALAPAAQATPHLELLCYRGRVAPNQSPVRSLAESHAHPNDVAATQLVFNVASVAGCDALVASDGLPSRPVTSPAGSVRMLRDPDGHLIRLEAPEGRTC
jgi:catechol 2,3-dioxygenase-like lactoylglutathione lyase family enzyme